ncbi:MAG: glycosyltransferase family 4 protein [Actinobacteria bacterium]|nr:MAG: glycosyltransferase family 4 protein [Actinomycetota bacterium]
MPFGGRCSRPITSCTRASSASGPPTSPSASRAGRGRCSTTPSTSTGSRYRLEVALHTLVQLPDARLAVSGRLVSDPRPLVERLRVAERVEFTGRYAQTDAPELFRRAHVLLHTKVKDPCPSAVIEAMACGLPVVYAASGGTVELVGDEAGIGVPHPDGWDRDEPPEPAAFAEAVARTLADRERLSAAARRRAVERFSLGPWLDRHAELFAELTASGPRARSSRTR